MNKRKKKKLLKRTEYGIVFSYREYKKYVVKFEKQYKKFLKWCEKHPVEHKELEKQWEF